MMFWIWLSCVVLSPLALIEVTVPPCLDHAMAAWIPGYHASLNIGSSQHSEKMTFLPARGPDELPEPAALLLVPEPGAELVAAGAALELELEFELPHPLSTTMTAAVRAAAIDTRAACFALRKVTLLTLVM
jgi:hypothetical protein